MGVGDRGGVVGGLERWAVEAMGVAGKRESCVGVSSDSVGVAVESEGKEPSNAWMRRARLAGSGPTFSWPFGVPGGEATRLGVATSAGGVSSPATASSVSTADIKCEDDFKGVVIPWTCIRSTAGSDALRTC